jgi:hypothetical protein
LSPSFREEEGQLEAEAPIFRSVVCRFSPVADAGPDLDGLVADGEKLADVEVGRDGPLIGFPIEAGFRIEGEGCFGRGDVGEKGLHKSHKMGTPCLLPARIRLGQSMFSDNFDFWK